MTNSQLLSIRSLSIRLVRSPDSFWDRVGISLREFGHRDGFVSNQSVLHCDFGNFDLSAGECYAINGREGCLFAAFFDLIEGKTKSNSGTIRVTSSISSIRVYLAKLKGKKTLATLLKYRVDGEKVLIFSDLLAQANLRMDDLSLSEKLRCATTLAIFDETKLVLLDEGLFLGDQIFFEKVLGQINISKQQGKAFLIAAPSLSAVKKVVDRAISYKFR